MSGATLSATEQIEAEAASSATSSTEKLIEASDELGSLSSLMYFGTAPNSKLLEYWDTVADRLYKIRNCQNIEEVRRSLALFEPPIDPALLVKAAAAGIDISTVLNDVSNATLPHYRFRVLAQKAVELCNDVKSLGQNLLSALEKKDAEQLSLLRASQEVNLLKAIREVKKQSIEESKSSLDSMLDSLTMAQTRQDFYASRKYINSNEKQQLKKLEKAMKFQNSAHKTSIVASAMAAIPEIKAGVAGLGPFYAIGKYGGSFYNVAQSGITVLNALSAIQSQEGSLAGIKGGYDRRKDDWELQLSLAETEIEQVTKQITAAQIRVALAERELVNHDMQLTQSEEVQSFMKYKFTNKDLYNWMVTQTANIYFKSYDLAYSVARMAERAFKHELAAEKQDFIQYGYWDSLKKGLMSGDRLLADLRRMEVAYLEQNKREYELTKHIPLSHLSPAQIINLRENGFCDFHLPEVLFDLDHPGQFMRRIKSVRITIPGVTGAYTNVNAKLTLLSSRTRKKTQLRSGSAPYAYEGEDDDRFNHNVGGIQSIATSSAQNDSGTFELNFQDERYLPFEGAGAISNWRLELNGGDFSQFDFDTVTDVILHMSYTAREGGESFKNVVKADLEVALGLMANWLADTETPMQRVFSLKTHFPNALYQLLQPIGSEDYQECSFQIKKEHFPTFLRSKTLALPEDPAIGVEVLIKQKDGITTSLTNCQVTIVGEVANTPVDPTNISGGALLPHVELVVEGDPKDTWTLTVSPDTTASPEPDISALFTTDEIEDVYLIFNYSITEE